MPKHPIAVEVGSLRGIQRGCFFRAVSSSTSAFSLTAFSAAAASERGLMRNF
jgi:hypothetical protein